MMRLGCGRCRVLFRWVAFGGGIATRLARLTLHDVAWLRTVPCSAQLGCIWRWYAPRPFFWLCIQIGNAVELFAVRRLSRGS
jgi:hypothetical protein